MKKTYQKPATEVVEVEMETMIATSIIFGDEYDGQKPVETKPSNSLLDIDAWD
ncbi:MAG: hypothetical protein J1F40_08275 [Prevotellaceae bacterium]|nr:hypothetical protein [Prevotellaceae bacterium]